MSKATDYAYGVLAKRRQESEVQADKTLDFLLSFPDYSQCYYAVKAQILTVARAVGEEKTRQRQTLMRMQDTLALLASQHGKEQSLTQPQRICPLCLDTGIYGATKCKCFVQLVRQYLLQESYVDEEKTFENAETISPSAQKAFEFFGLWADKYPDVKKQNAYIHGKTGVGKTYLVHAIANRLITKDQSVLVLTASDLNRAFLQYHLSNLDEKQELWSAFAATDILLIDDLGAENCYQNVTENYLFDLLNQRKRKKLGTVIASNLSPDKLYDRYGERIFSRIADDNDTFKCEIASPDRRTIRAK